MKTSHPSEQERELYASMPDVLSAERRSTIESHIRRCRRCREEITRLHSFFEDVHQRLSDSPKEIDRVIAQRLSIPQSPKSLPPWEGRLLTDTDAPIIRSSFGLMRYVKQNPLKTGGVVSLAAALVIAVAALLKTPADTNPAKAAVRNSVLYVYNSAGQLLWTKEAPGLPNDSSNLVYRTDFEQQQLYSVVDIDGDSRNEVLLSNGSRPVGAGTLSCYNSDGMLRWNYLPSGGIRWGSLDLSNQSYVINLFLPVVDKERRLYRLVVVAHALPHWPAMIVSLDPQSGQVLHTYWHAGHPSVGLVADVNGDGKKEVVIGGVNNLFHSAFVVILDPESFHGVAPTTEAFAPQQLEKGNEMYYLLFPQTDYGKLPGGPGYNSTVAINISSRGFLDVRTKEGFLEKSQAKMVYILDKGLAVTSALGDDFFLHEHEEARQSGKLKEQATAAYFERVRKSVLYWDGDAFVSRPTMNKRYWSGKNLP